MNRSRAGLFSSSLNSSVEQTGPFCGDRALKNKKWGISLRYSRTETRHAALKHKIMVDYRVHKRCSEEQPGLLLYRALMKNLEGRCRGGIPQKLLRFGSHQFKVPSLKPFDLFLTCSDPVFVTCYAVLIWHGVFGSCIIQLTMVCRHMIWNMACIGRVNPTNPGHKGVSVCSTHCKNSSSFCHQVDGPVTDQALPF